MTILVNNLMQKGYKYERVMPEGDLSDLKEKGFNPELSPAVMFELGIMGGKYYSDVADSKEFPKSFSLILKSNSVGVKNKPRVDLNLFKVGASQSLKAWRDNGWIIGDDPRGWIEWYCRTWYGRRTEYDIQQIKRWKSYTARTIGQVKKNCSKGDKCRLKQKQGLLHWAIDSRRL